MHETTQRVERHYGRADLLTAILSGLRDAGKDLQHLTPPDLAPVDEFHLRGREPTIELAQLAQLQPGERVLDVGCGLGGSVRYLASEHGCRAAGVDLTREYIDIARELSRLVGLDSSVDYHVGSALELPFADAEFDAVWTEHAQMNIADKTRLYSEMARVLVAGGRLAFHDVFAGPRGAPHFPVPWADDAAISFLAPADDVRTLLGRLGFERVAWLDKTEQAKTWLTARLQSPAPPPLGVHLLMGASARKKLENMLRNLAEERVVLVQAVARKS